MYSHTSSRLIAHSNSCYAILKGPLFNGLLNIDGKAHCQGDGYQGNGYQATEFFWLRECRLISEHHMAVKHAFLKTAFIWFPLMRFVSYQLPLAWWWHFVYTSFSYSPIHPGRAAAEFRAVVRFYFSPLAGGNCSETPSINDNSNMVSFVFWASMSINIWQLVTWQLCLLLYTSFE